MVKTAFQLATQSGKVPQYLNFVEPEVDEQIEGDEPTQNGDLASRVKAMEGNQVMATLLADPDIRKVIELKRGGKAISIAEAADETPSEEPADETDPEIAALDDKDPLKSTLQKIDALINNKLKKALGGLQTIDERLKGVESVAGSVQSREVKDQIKSAKEKFEDFDEYKTQMTELVKAIPGLNVEELYILAKQRAGKLKLNKPSTFSERPTVSQRGMAPPRKGNAPRPQGRKGWSQLVAEGLAGLDLNEKE